jgi:ubiquinone/menaquinone biosynthesis C-methylase UbiE
VTDTFNGQEQRKEDVRLFWETMSCGEVYAEGDSLAARLESQARLRYEMEPYLRDFARFEGARGLDVLEVGVGMGADHCELARCLPRSLSGVDLTERAVEFTRKRLALYGLTSALRQADAEKLPFEDQTFDLVYSWGVLHHSPDTQKAIDEVWRVLRPGGRARIMIYNKWSIVGLLLWARYGLATGRPFVPFREIYAQHLESPGTKAYTIREAEQLFRRFSDIRIRPQLSMGDLLEGKVGQRHQGLALSMAKALWPRSFVRRALPRLGLYLLIDARRT